MANIVVTNNANAAFFDITLNDMKAPAKTVHDVVSIRKSDIAFVQHRNTSVNSPAFLEIVLLDDTTYHLETTAEFAARLIIDPAAQPVGLLIDSVCAVACTTASQTRDLIVLNS